MWISSKIITSLSTKGEVTASSVIKTNDSYMALLALIMRLETVGNGELRMLMVGNVDVNRVPANRLDY